MTFPSAHAVALSTLLAFPSLALADVTDAIVPIGVVGTVFGFNAVFIGIVAYTLFRLRRLRHETIRMAIEKGQPIPPGLLDPQRRPERPHRDLRTGLILVGAGAGIAAFLRLTPWTGVSDAWSVGLVPGFLGCAYLVAFALSRRLSRTSEVDAG